MAIYCLNKVVTSAATGIKRKQEDKLVPEVPESEKAHSTTQTVVLDAAIEVELIEIDGEGQVIKIDSDLMLENFGTGQAASAWLLGVLAGG